LMSGNGEQAIETVEKLAATHGLSVAGHLHKPFRPTELENLLRQHALRQDTTVVQQDSGIDFDDDELRRTVERDEFVLHYQPQIDVATSKVVGLEALVRWMHPKRCLTFPDSFLPGIKNLGIFDEFARLIVDLELSEVRRFADKDHRISRLALNVVMDSLRDVGFPDTLVSLAKKHGVPAANVVVEIAGTEIMNEQPPTLDVLTRLRMKNFQLSVHDYETGCVGIQQLRKISATELKIDRAIVQNMLVNDRDRVMAQKIIMIAHELDMMVLAEGVETQEQLEFLGRKGCDYLQGFLFSLPQPPLGMAPCIGSIV